MKKIKVLMSSLLMTFFLVMALGSYSSSTTTSTSYLNDKDAAELQVEHQDDDNLVCAK